MQINKELLTALQLLTESVRGCELDQTQRDSVIIADIAISKALKK